MNFVVFDAFDVNGLKCAEADVKGDVDGVDSALADAVENLRSEVETGGGRGD